MEAPQAKVTDVAVRPEAVGAPGAVGGVAAAVVTAVDAEAAEATPVESTALT